MLNKDQLLSLYRQMWLMRHFEARLTALSRDGILRGSLHLATGQEALPAGTGLALRKTDAITVTYRGHGYVLAKGCDLKLVFAEILGREAGMCRGKGGKMHLVDPDNGLLGANGIVGAGVPIAVGAALNARLTDGDAVAVAVFGDGALNQGVVHETLNMAALWKLPVIFLCENNLYAEMTPLDRSSAVTELCSRMAAYGIPAHQIDGNDPIAVYEAVSSAAVRARSGKGPTFIEALTYRTCGHYQADAETYRTKEEIRTWETKSPISRFEIVLKAKKVTDGELEVLQAAALEEVNLACDWALKCPAPAPETRFQDVFA